MSDGLKIGALTKAQKTYNGLLNSIEGMKQAANIYTRVKEAEKESDLIKNIKPKEKSLDNIVAEIEEGMYR